MVVGRARVGRAPFAGVPSFWVAGQLFWGGDRMHFVEKALGNTRAAQPRFQLPPPGGVTQRRRLTVYHDFSSPWRCVGGGGEGAAAARRCQDDDRCKRNDRAATRGAGGGPRSNALHSYIGSTQIERVAREAGPGVQLEVVPILLGAVFKQCGALPRAVRALHASPSLPVPRRVEGSGLATTEQDRNAQRAHDGLQRAKACIHGQGHAGLADVVEH